jgi:hypothetical protein
VGGGKPPKKMLMSPDGFVFLTFSCFTPLVVVVEKRQNKSEKIQEKINKNKKQKMK